MRASIKSKYDGGSAGHSATTTLAVGLGDLKLKASCSDATFSNLQIGGGGGGGGGRPSLQGVSLGVEKPGSFMIDYELEKRAARFQFMSAASVGGKQVKLTYIHPQGRNATVVEGSLAVDAANKVTAKYSFATGKGTLKYSYVHGGSDLTLEPWYDFATESWNFAVSKKLGKSGQSIKAMYEPRPKSLGLEWLCDDRRAGQFKVAATVFVGTSKPPKLLLEKTWNTELFA